MDSYTEVTVIAEGALDSTEEFNGSRLGDEAFDAYWLKLQEDVRTNVDITFEVYILNHPHYMGMECECSQFVTDGRPAFVSEAGSPTLDLNR